MHSLWLHHRLLRLRLLVKCRLHGCGVAARRLLRIGRRLHIRLLRGTKCWLLLLLLELRLLGEAGVRHHGCERSGWRKPKAAACDKAAGGRRLLYRRCRCAGRRHTPLYVSQQGLRVHPCPRAQQLVQRAVQAGPAGLPG